MVVINIPICDACFQALYALYSQKISEIRLLIRPYCGSLNEVSRNPSIVNPTKPICIKRFRVRYFFIQLGLINIFGGEGGIRTLGTSEGTPVFKTGALNHYATSPALITCGCLAGADVSPDAY